jgi:hypothetical protein
MAATGLTGHHQVKNSATREHQVTLTQHLMHLTMASQAKHGEKGRNVEV